MPDATTAWARRYQKTLHRFLRQTARPCPPAVAKLGAQAAVLGLETLTVAGIHAAALASAKPPAGPPEETTAARAERADTFFKETLVPIEATHLAAREADREIDRTCRTLQRREAESTASATRLQRATVRREVAETSAGERAEQHDEVLREAQDIKERLRNQMQLILALDETERQRIGTALRDEIAQTLLAIDLSLLTIHTSGGQPQFEYIEKSIAEAQRLLQPLSGKGLR